MQQQQPQQLLQRKMIDNRKKSKDDPQECNNCKYNYPEANRAEIDRKTYEEVADRNRKSQLMKAEKQNSKQQEILYDISNFEIYLASTSSSKKSLKQSSPDRYIHIDKIDSDKMICYIQGVVTGPTNSKYYNQLIYAEISEYSLQYGEKSEWSLWIQVSVGGDPWFKLGAPYHAYAKFFSPMNYRFRVVMNTTDFFENKTNKKRDYTFDKLEKFLEKNFKEYSKGDILGFKDEVLKHVAQFLDVRVNCELLKSINREMEEVILEKKNNPTKENIEIHNFPEPHPFQNVQIDRIQNEINKDLKKLKNEMNDYFNRREIDSEIIVEESDDEADSNVIREEYGGLGYDDFTEEDLEQIKDTSYGYNYDFDFNYDDDAHANLSLINDKREREPPVDTPSVEYLSREDKLNFEKLPAETIAFKPYNSLYSLPNGHIVELEPSSNFNFDEEDSTDNILPFLVCRICGQGKHIVGATCNSGQEIDKDISDSIEEYILHLEKHRMELLRSLSKKSRDRLDRSIAFNNILNRSKIEKVESNAYKQQLRKKKSLLNLKLKLKQQLSNKNNK